MMNKPLVYIVSMLLLFSACTEKEAIPTSAHIPVLEITAEDFQPAFIPGTRMAETGYVTTFSDGDQIGITGMIEGRIVDDMNNVCCTYAAATDKWTLASGKNLFLYDNVSYIAYYPYQSAMDGKKTLEDIVAAFSPLTSQADYKTGYSASCLMIATGVVDADQQKLSFNFAHAMTMLELQFYKDIGGAKTLVMLGAGSTIQVKSGGKNYTFNVQNTGNRYRLFLKPASSFDWNISFTADGADYSNALSGLTTPAAGKYLHYDMTFKSGAGNRAVHGVVMARHR